MSESNISFEQILSDLRRLCESGASGAIFVATSDNRSAQFALDRGRIVYLYYANRVGLSALEEMAGIRSGRYRFQPGANSLPRLDLPETEVILAALEAGSGQSLSMAGSTEDALSSGPRVDPLTQTQREVLRSCLSDFVGPIAEILCEDHLASAPSLDAAIDALARELPSGNQVQQFRSMVRAKLG